MDNQGRTGGGWILKGTARTGSNQEQSNLYKPFPGFPHLSRTDPEGGSILRGGFRKYVCSKKCFFGIRKEASESFFERRYGRDTPVRRARLTMVSSSLVSGEKCSLLFRNRETITMNNFLKETSLGEGAEDSLEIS